jgi:DNA integrity scanning protein DisA with diadenylate cyclase activity
MSLLDDFISLAKALQSLQTKVLDLKTQEDNQRNIFSILVQSVINKVLPINIQNGAFDKGTDLEYVENHITRLLNSMGNCSPSLFGIHLRSKYITDGRLSVAGAMNPNASPQINQTYHSNLLKTYFAAFDRINTFNDRLFEIFYSSQTELALYRIRFGGPDTNMLFKEVGIERNIIIPTILARKLLEPDTRNHFLFLRNNTAINLETKWDSQLRAISVLNKLNKAREKVWFEEVANEGGFKKWKPLLRFLDFQNQPNDWNTISEWNLITRMHLKCALRFLQGILLYQEFATQEITTIITRIRDNESALGMTIGVSDTESQSFVKTLQDSIADVKNLIVRDRFEIPPRIREQAITPRMIFGNGLWVKLAREQRLNLELFSACAHLINNIRKLSFEVHEGEDLVFTFYIGKQTALTRFKEIYNFKEKEKNDLDFLSTDGSIEFNSILKSHYSLFRDNITGVFIDYMDRNQIMIVKPYKVLPKLNHDFEEYTEEEILSINEQPHQVFESLSDSIKDFIVLQVGSGRMSIYYNGKFLLGWPDREDYRWWSPLEKSATWTSKEELVELFEKCFAGITGATDKTTAINNLANAVIRCSETPGAGAMIVLEKPEGATVIEGMRSTLNPKKLSIWQGKAIFECSTDDLFNIIIPDGATLIHTGSGIIENQIQVVPIVQKDNRGIAKDLSEITGVKGTRHVTAQALSAINEKCAVICISVDGPISVFYKGNGISQREINNIVL